MGVIPLAGYWDGNTTTERIGWRAVGGREWRLNHPCGNCLGMTQRDTKGKGKGKETIATKIATTSWVAPARPPPSQGRTGQRTNSSVRVPTKGGEGEGAKGRWASILAWSVREARPCRPRVEYSGGLDFG